MAWATSRPGVAASRKAGTSARRRRSTQSAASAPPAMPPQTPTPPCQIASGPHHWCGTSFQLVARELDAAADPAAGEAPHRVLGASRAAVVVALRSTARRSHAAAAFAAPRLSPFADGDEGDEQRDGGV